MRCEHGEREERREGERASESASGREGNMNVMRSFPRLLSDTGQKKSTEKKDGRCMSFQRPKGTMEYSVSPRDRTLLFSSLCLSVSPSVCLSLSLSRCLCADLNVYLLCSNFSHCCLVFTDATVLFVSLHQRVCVCVCVCDCSVPLLFLWVILIYYLRGD